MTAESMLFNGAIVAIVLVLVGLAWGFLLLKIQGGEAGGMGDGFYRFSGGQLPNFQGKST